jgi:hypothetical protein
VLEQPEASKSAGRRRKTPSRLLRGRKFQEQVIAKLSWKEWRARGEAGSEPERE